MSKSKMRKASLGLTRHLSPVQVDTLRVALRMLVNTHSTSVLIVDARVQETVDEILSDRQIERLIVDLMYASEVTVCRAQTERA